MFYTLEEKGFSSAEATEKMIKAVGLRNLLIHEYRKVDLKRVFKTAHENVQDLKDFLIEIFNKLEISV